MIGSEEFWSHVDRSGDGCWEWKLCLGSNGYGQAKYAHSVDEPGKKQSTHRIAWRIANGPIPLGLHVLHKCDNRKCCRPDHLFLGTNYDNVQDMIRKGRRWTNPPHGEDSGRAKLTEKQVLSIVSDGRMQRVIAEEYGVCQQLVSRIKQRRVWVRLVSQC